MRLSFYKPKLRRRLKDSGLLEGQILALTLILLFIAAIVSLATFNTVSRSGRQNLLSTQYQNLYNESENQIFSVAELYGIGGNTISNITSTYPGLCTINSADKVTCNLNNGGSGGINTRVILEDSSTIVNYELTKDQFLDIDITNYTGTVYFSTTGTDVALELGLLYVDSTTTPQYVADLFDPNNLFTNNGGNPITDPNNTHDFVFANAGGGEYSFTINQISGWVGTNTAQRVRFTARMPTEGSVYLSIRGNVGFPTQVRTITASSYYVTTNSPVVANAQTQIPKLLPTFGLLEYALISNNSVSKQTVSF